MTTRLNGLFDEQGQSPWLDNLTRPYLLNGTLAGLVADGVRGVTANPTIVAKAIESSNAYDDQFHGLITAGHAVEDAYWDLVIADVVHALRILRPTFDAANGDDGFVSIEVAPECANDAHATIGAARALHERIREPNLLVKIPATTQGVPAIKVMIGEGRSINVTLIFSLARYGEVLEAYLSGLETLARRGGDLSRVHSVASFFVSRVDSEADRRLEDLGTPEALALCGRAAVAQAKVAYQLFRNAHTGERWKRLSERVARVQRPLRASTSTKNPHYSDTLYIDDLIGPDTPTRSTPWAESTMQAFEDHGTLARTIDTDVAGAEETLHELATTSIDMDDIGHTLENQGIVAFQVSYTHVLGTLGAKAHARSDG